MKMRTNRSQLLLALIAVLMLTLACSLSGGAPAAAEEDSQEAATSGTMAEATTTAESMALPEKEDATPAAEATSAEEAAPMTQPSIPDPGGYAWAEVASGFNRPLYLTHAGDGSGRLFVLEQDGVVQVIENGQTLATPFLDIRSRVGSQGNEQGLLGLAFHPNYAENGIFYVDYTDLIGNTVVARYSVSGDQNRADPDSETIVLQVSQPYANHNGGDINFGPDGYLYISLGDGGSGGDPGGNGQNTNTLLGAILRIDVDGGAPYAIPADNPFAGGGGQPEIWVYGLRNPWRFSFDRQTGDFYIGDVGQNVWEEIDFLPAGTGGVNFGWNYFEGNHAFVGNPPDGLAAVFPVAEYRHEGSCSVTGGYVYRGAQLPAWNGVYLYADFCSGEIFGLLQGSDGQWQNQSLFGTGQQITSFGQDESGELYFVGRGGNVFQLVAQ
jgi:glucose/arabinose dehydrogenase